MSLKITHCCVVKQGVEKSLHNHVTMTTTTTQGLHVYDSRRIAVIVAAATPRLFPPRRLAELEIARWPHSRRDRRQQQPFSHTLRLISSSSITSYHTHGHCTAKN